MPEVWCTGKDSRTIGERGERRANEGEALWGEQEGRGEAGLLSKKE